ncbi:MAG: PH domain-containing protein [Actinomycetes bacterium]
MPAGRRLPHQRAPARISGYLLDSETLVLAVRRHPAQVAEPVLSTVAGLVVALWITWSLPRDVPVLADVVWWAWFVLAARAVWKLLEWRTEWFVATDRRLLLTWGLLTRKVAMMPLIKVTDLSYNRSLLGRLLGFGEFVLESAGQDQALHDVNWLPCPDELYRRICAQMFDPLGRNRVGASASPLPPAALVTGTVPGLKSARVGSQGQQTTEEVPGPDDDDRRRDPGDD